MSSLSLLLLFDIEGKKINEKKKLCWFIKALNSGKLCSFMIQVLYLPTLYDIFLC